jgi:hypothetical protein
MVDGRRVTVKRTRCDDGTPPLRRDLSPSLEAATAATMGGPVCRSDAAAAPGAKRGGAATSGTAAVVGLVIARSARLRLPNLRRRLNTDYQASMAPAEARISWMTD